MKTVIGKYNKADIFTDLVEESAIEQIKTLCDQPFVDGCRIAIMPDVHSGAGCVIGFTADLGELVIPNIVGVDIGCGMLTVCLGNLTIDFKFLDKVIHDKIPSGMSVHDSPIEKFGRLTDLRCYNSLKNIDWIRNSIGTLGGGNHFIEVDCDERGNKYLVIHTGSRNLGKQVAEYYQQVAINNLIGKNHTKELRKQLIKEYKESGRKSELSAALAEFNRQKTEESIPKELCYLADNDRADYLHDMKICQEFAIKNRMTIANTILSTMFGSTIDKYEWFETIHNYIDYESNIIRKGAVSAKAGERLLIPINMRDGSLICIGKGNPDWNYSAPHGAGRLYSRNEAKKKFSVKEYESEMLNVYTTSVNNQTLDECPMAYKPMESIIDNISPTVEIERIIKPIYNFKASE